MRHLVSSLLSSSFLSKSGQCVSCLSHCHYQSNVCLRVHQLRRLCSSIYLARNIRECQQNLTPEIVRAFLRANQSQTPDRHEDDKDEPVSSTYHGDNCCTNENPSKMFRQVFFESESRRSDRLCLCIPARSRRFVDSSFYGILSHALYWPTHREQCEHE